MKYDFDIIIDRSQNSERKWDQLYIAKNYHLTGDNIINSSIADLDFLTPPPIVNAILERAKKEFTVILMLVMSFIKPLVIDIIISIKFQFQLIRLNWSMGQLMLYIN